MAQHTHLETAFRPSFGKIRGFTLVEVMIVVAIIGILAAIAYPMYQDYLLRARRADAQAALTGLSAVAERFFSDTNDYTGLNAAIGAGGIFPNWAPIDGPQASAFYTLTSNNESASTYQLRAVPVAGLLMEGDGCFVLNSTGQRLWDRDAACNGAGTTEDWNN
ncbi:MAG: prepilin-type N-terminal cleavage/methylation domain-containing protein [Gammaproteobacteria bacterium]|nr:prepilin-type N-terminal cleavage/methylation domain-containing protein [Gammaproteobacteria bacterium]